MTSPAAFVGLCAVAFFVSPGSAQVAPSDPPDSARITEARHMLEANGSVDLMLTVIRSGLPAQRAALPQLPAEFWTRMEKRLSQDAPLLMDSITVLYARTFTLEDLRALRAFYTS